MRTKSIPTLTPQQESNFWSKVDVPYQPSCCWTWTASAPHGYGRFQLWGWPGKVYAFQAHRVAYTLLVGPIEAEMTIDHLCRNARCVNPDHMRIASFRENVLGNYSPPSQNHRKTHCKRGHEFTPENTYYRPSRPGVRECRECSHARNR